MMAAMMEGSQSDFIKTLVDALPHISVTDELREPTRQPANIVYCAAEFHGLTPKARRPGIKNPMAIIRYCSSSSPSARAALLRKRILDLISAQRSQRVENDRDVNHLLKQSTLNGRDITQRSGDHTEQR